MSDRPPKRSRVSKVSAGYRGLTYRGLTRVARLDVARAERRYGSDIAPEFAQQGAATARTKDIGDPELWRAVARKIAHDQGHRVATHLHVEHGVVSAVLTDQKATDAEIRLALERLSRLFLGPQLPAGNR